MMADTTAPLVSVGLPVHNGEKYLAEALDSILAQTLDDIEVVVSDNASTDRTAEICSAYAASDPRVRYFRQTTNIGGARNFNFVFLQSRGSYFQWIAHDDICTPMLLQRCIATLEEHPDHVAAYTRHHTIDDAGNRVAEGGSTTQLGSADPHVRLATALCHPEKDKVPPWAIFGVIRRSALEQTRLHGNYTGSDRTLVVELALQGPLYEIDEFLFLNRDHPDRALRVGERAENAGKRGHFRETFHSPTSTVTVVFPNWTRLGAFTSAIANASVPAAVKLRSYGALAEWLFDGNWRNLLFDLRLAARMYIDRLGRSVNHGD